MIMFNRKQGALYDQSGGLIAHGIWSGHGDAANDPSREQEKGVGPLPAGLYTIGEPMDGGHLGPFVMKLTQIEGESYDRGGFYMHGDHANDTDHSASDGCVIAGLIVRQAVNGFADRRLRVI